MAAATSRPLDWNANFSLSLPVLALWDRRSQYSAGDARARVPSPSPGSASPVRHLRCCRDVHGLVWRPSPRTSGGGPGGVCGDLLCSAEGFGRSELEYRQAPLTQRLSDRGADRVPALRLPADGPTAG